MGCRKGPLRIGGAATGRFRLDAEAGSGQAGRTHSLHMSHMLPARQEVGLASRRDLARCSRANLPRVRDQARGRAFYPPAAAPHPPPESGHGVELSCVPLAIRHDPRAPTQKIYALLVYGRVTSTAPDVPLGITPSEKSTVTPIASALARRSASPSTATG